MKSNGNKKRTLLLAIVMAILVVMGISSISIFADENNSSAVASVIIGSVTTEYDSFAAAVAATKGVKEDCTIKLLKDTLEDEIFLTDLEDINKTVTIDFGSNTLRCTELKTSTYSTVILEGTTGGVDGNLTFYFKGTIESGVYHGTIKAWLLGKVRINGGTFTSNSKMFWADGADIDIYGGTFTGSEGICCEDNFGRIYVRGGTFTLINDSNALFNANNNGYISVNDGTFIADTDIAVSSDADCILNGGTFIGGITTKISNLNAYLGHNRQYWIGDTPQTVTDDQKEISGGDVTVDVPPVAKVGNSYFKTLEAAVDEYNSTGNTLQLLQM